MYQGVIYSRTETHSGPYCMERPVLAHNGTSKLHKTGRGDRAEGAAMTGGAKSPGYEQKSRI